jgi:membrane associated rhomboid family serine protease
MSKIQYNSPVILTFSLIAVLVHTVNYAIPDFTKSYFVVWPSVSLINPLDYFRLVSHVIGHSGWGHLINNLTFILLLGPILEEKYGRLSILFMIMITGLVTGIINILFFSTGLLGASGIVFMLIILASMADIREGSIPLTFILVAGIFISNEVLNAFKDDNISQMAHIIGGGMGAVFGFVFSHPKKQIQGNQSNI